MMDYSQEVPHSDHLVVRGTEPFNAEPPAAALVEFPITPEDLVYCRNHGPVLDLDESTYTIEVHGLQGSRSHTLKGLRKSFPRVEVVAALQVRSFVLFVPSVTNMWVTSARATDEKRWTRRSPSVVYSGTMVLSATRDGRASACATSC